MHAERHLASFKLSIMGLQMTWTRYFLINLVFIGYGPIAKTIRVCATSFGQEDLQGRVSMDVRGWLKIKVNSKSSEGHGILNKLDFFFSRSFLCFYVISTRKIENN